MVMKAIANLRADVEKLKQKRQPERASTALRSNSAPSWSRVNTSAGVHQPLTDNVSIPGSKDSTDGFSGFRSPESEVSCEEGGVQEDVYHGSILP